MDPRCSGQGLLWPFQKFFPFLWQNSSFGLWICTSPSSRTPTPGMYLSQCNKPNWSCRGSQALGLVQCRHTGQAGLIRAPSWDRNELWERECYHLRERAFPRMKPTERKEREKESKSERARWAGETIFLELFGSRSSKTLPLTSIMWASAFSLKGVWDEFL